MMIPVSPHSHPHLLQLSFDYSHPQEDGVVSHCDLICISLMANDVEHLFMCISVTYISSLKKSLFRSFVHFSIRLIIFLLLSGKSSMYFLNNER